MGFFTIKGGLVWDGKVFSPNQEKVFQTTSEKDEVLELRDEDLVIPGGLVDMHAHLWAPPAVHSFGVASEIYYTEGFSGAVDAGTYGVNDWEAANRYWKENVKMRVKSFLSVLPEGLTVFPPVTPTKPGEISEDQYVEMISCNKGDALGIKVQLGWLNYKSAESDSQLLNICRHVADRTGTHMMVHVSGQCMDARDSANMMQKQDIITHPYSGFANTILDSNGTLYPELLAAKERGVVFDVGYAGKHFSWRVFEKAYAQGLTFDTMGADLATVSYKTPKSIIRDQYHVLSAFLNFGIDLNEVFAAWTSAPTQYLEFETDLADTCTVLCRKDCETVFVDGQGDQIRGTFEYIPEVVIQHGAVLQCRPYEKK